MAEASLSCYTRPEGRLTLLVFEGTLDLATAPQATDWIQRVLAEHGPNLVVDTSRLDFIDSKGVGALLGGAKAAQDAGGKLYLPNPALPVRKILEMCGLTTLFPAIFPSPPPAEASAAKAEPAPTSSRAATATRTARKAA